MIVRLSMKLFVESAFLLLTRSDQLTKRRTDRCGVLCEVGSFLGQVFYVDYMEQGLEISSTIVLVYRRTVDCRHREYDYEGKTWRYG